MKNLLVVLVFALIMASCATPSVVSGKVAFRDGKQNDYVVAYTDNTEAKIFKALIDIRGKTYSCEVDYTTAPADAFGIDIDVSALDITGKVKFSYKKVTVECSLQDDVPDSEVADIIKEEEDK